MQRLFSLSKGGKQQTDRHVIDYYIIRSYNNTEPVWQLNLKDIFFCLRGRTWTYHKGRLTVKRLEKAQLTILLGMRLQNAKNLSSRSISSMKFVYEHYVMQTKSY